MTAEPAAPALRGPDERKQGPTSRVPPDRVGRCLAAVPWLALAGTVAVALETRGAAGEVAGAAVGLPLIAVAAVLLALGHRPSAPVVLVAVGLLALATWSVASIAWGGLPYPALRNAGGWAIGAAAAIAGSALGPRVRPFLLAIAAGIGLHAARVLVTVGAGWSPDDWFLGRQLEGPTAYHNAEAVAMALGLPLMLVAVESTRRWTRAAAGAGACLLVAVAGLTQSRAALVAGAAAVLLYVGVARTLRAAVVAAACALSTAVLFPLLRQVDRALVAGRPLDDDAFARYGATALGLAVAAAVVAAVPLRPIRLGRRWRRVGAATGAAVVLALLAVVTAAVVPRLEGARGRLTAEPNQPSKVGAGATRFSSVSTSGRLELWHVALEMGGERPVTGRGAGSFTRRWTIERTNKDAYVLRPHSLELEALAELGIVGLALVLVAGGGIAWAVRRGVSRDRVAGAAAGATALALLLVASVDYVYTYPGLLAPMLAVVGAAPPPRRRGRTAPVGAAAIAVAAGAAAAILVSPAAGRVALDRARQQADRSVPEALATLDTARRWSPWDPDVLLLQGRLVAHEGAFARAARIYARTAALSRQPWMPWFAEAAVLWKAGLREESADACRRTYAANPLDPIYWHSICDDVE